MADVLIKVRTALGKKAKIALFWDNCRIHHSNIVKELAKKEDINI